MVQQRGSLLHSEALQAVVLPRQWQRSGPAVRSPGERHGHQSSSPSCLKLWEQFRSKSTVLRLLKLNILKVIPFKSRYKSSRGFPSGSLVNKVKEKVKVAQSCLRNSPGKSTRVGSLPLLQGIFPTQGSNPGLRIAG